MINDDDKNIILRASVSEGVANSRQAALARAVLAFETELEKRLDRIEAALKDLDLPDVPALEETIGDLQARLGRLESALGETPSKAQKKRS